MRHLVLGAEALHITRYFIAPHYISALRDLWWSASGASPTVVGIWNVPCTDLTCPISLHIGIGFSKLHTLNTGWLDVPNLYTWMRDAA
jgi:hypothetical protein